MKIVNLNTLPELAAQSPKGKYGSFVKNVSGALGAKVRDQPGEHHPFDLQIRRIPPGKSVCPYHQHTAQWELFVVVSGQARVRRNGETYDVKAGDVFVQPPGTAHQLTNSSETEDLVVQIIADNPAVDLHFYPDSNKHATTPDRKVFRLQEVDYFDGEE